MAKRYRDWTQAECKRGPCRVCGSTWRVELAHVTRREFDDVNQRGIIVVDPDSVVPLCGPATEVGTCHHGHDSGLLDLLPHLTRAEQVRAVSDVGLENARIRTCPSDYKPPIEDARQLAAIDEASRPSPAYR